jgi:hypothetical protein
LSFYFPVEERGGLGEGFEGFEGFATAFAMDGFGRPHEFEKPPVLLSFGQLGRLGRLLFFLKKGNIVEETLSDAVCT